MSTTTPTVEDARDRIDEIDRQFVELLAERYAVVDDLCERKADNGDTVKDPDREAELMDHVATIAEQNGLSPDLVRRLYEEILAHSVQRQRRRREDAEAPNAQGTLSEENETHSNSGAASTTSPAVPEGAETGKRVPLEER